MAKVWTTKDKIQEGIRLKDEGNAYVKTGELKKALKSYKTVFLYVNGLICKLFFIRAHTLTLPHIAKDNEAMAKFAGGDLLTEQDAETIKDLKVNTHSNLALCYTKLGMLDKVVDNCEKALQINPKHVKSLIRLGATEITLLQLDRAKRHLLKAHELEPQNPNLQQEMRNLKLALEKASQQQKEKDKQTFGGKFL